MTTLTTTKSNDKLVASGAFSLSDVEAISANEPKWLQEQRRVSWGLFEEIPLPTTSDEAWRRTDIRKVKWDKFHLADAAHWPSCRKMCATPLKKSTPPPVGW